MNWIYHLQEEQTMNKLTLLQQMDFCIQELTLYLDTHPNDLYAFRLLKRPAENGS